MSCYLQPLAIERNQTLRLFIYKTGFNHNAAKSESEGDFAFTEFIAYLEVIQTYCLIPFARVWMAYDHHSVNNYKCKIVVNFFQPTVNQ